MEHYTLRLEKRQSEVVESMAENGDAENASEAVRDAIEHYAQSMGYVNGHKKDTTLRKLARRFADATTIAAVVWTGVFWFSPMSLRLVALPLLGAAVTLYGFDRVLSQWEPTVTKRIRGVFSRGGNA